MVILSQIIPSYAQEDVYKLHSGDEISVSVWREDDLNRSAIVLPDGSITLPLIGRIVVSGLSTPMIEEKLKEKFSLYISDPVVTVTINFASGNRFFVLGKVTRPSDYVMAGPTTVAQALSMAGGLAKFANENEIKILRGYGELAKYIPYNYNNLLAGENGVDASIMLQAGDVIIVP